MTTIFERGLNMEFSPETSRALEALGAALIHAVNQQSQANDDYNRAFEEAFRLFDEAGYEGQPVTYITGQNKVIERRISRPAERLDAAALAAELAKTPAGKRLWAKIAKPTNWEVDLAALQIAMLRGRVDPDTVAACITRPNPVVSRHFRAASKADIQSSRFEQLRAVPSHSDEEEAAG